MAPHPLIGNPAPSLSLTNYNGDRYDFRPGKRPVALFFYPKAGSYGCVREACSFRDAVQSAELFKKTKLQVIGVSPDPVIKQARFVEKQKLNYPVLSDVDGEARQAYQVGTAFFGLALARITFLINEEGIVHDVLDASLSFKAHTKFVARWLATMSTEEDALALHKILETNLMDGPQGTGNGVEDDHFKIERVSEKPPRL